MKNERQVERNEEIVRRHKAGQTFDAIGKEMGIPPKTASTVYYREIERALRIAKPKRKPSESTLKRQRRAAREAAETPAVAGYSASMVRQVHGHKGDTPAYTPPLSLRLAGIRAAAFQPPLISCASKVQVMGKELP